MMISVLLSFSYKVHILSYIIDKCTYCLVILTMTALPNTGFVVQKQFKSFFKTIL